MLTLRRYLDQYGSRAAIGKRAGVVLLFVFLCGGVTAAPLRIAALGDSLTQGYGLPPEAGLVPQLQSWLERHGHDVTILNAGVSGDTTAGGLARVDWTLTPDIGAVIVNLGGNDILRGIAPSVSRANLDAILKKISGRGLPVLVVGLSSPSNYGPAYKAEFDDIYPALATKYDDLLFADYLAALNETGDRASILARYMQKDGIHPNGKGVKLIVARLGPTVEKLILRAEQK